MIVADASIVVDLLLGPGSPGGDRLRYHLGRGESIVVPHLVDAEVAQTLRRLWYRGDLSDIEADAMLADFLDIPLRRYPHFPLLARAFVLRTNVTVYDALYLALAEALDAVLVTGDAALVDVPGCRAAVEVVLTSR